MTAQSNYEPNNKHFGGILITIILIIVMGIIAIHMQGCKSFKHAANVMSMPKNHGKAAVLCNTLFPTVVVGERTTEKQTSDTQYTAPVIQAVDCAIVLRNELLKNKKLNKKVIDSLINLIINAPTVQVKCPPAKVVTVYKDRETIITELDTRSLEVCRDSLRAITTKCQKEAVKVTDLGKERDFWLKVCLVTWMAIAVYLFITRLLPKMIGK